jgi:hypothetical protein
MSRQKGTPNKKKETYTAAIAETEKVIKQVEVKQEVIPEKTVFPKYEIAIGYGEGSFKQVVNALFDFGYVCQGGVSVTNYRGLDGKIVMVYCQAMIRKEM